MHIQHFEYQAGIKTILACIWLCSALLFFRNHSPLCSPATESIAEPPLSEPTLPPCSAGEVRSVEPSVAAVLPSSSDAGAEIIAIAVTVNTLLGYMILVYTCAPTMQHSMQYITK